MKRCSTCKRTYTDPNLSFCIDDGTPLTAVDPQDESTVVMARDGGAENWNEAPYRPPTAYVPPGTQPRRRRVWPWVVGIGGAFVLGIVAISIAAAVLMPRWIRVQQDQPPVVASEPANTNQAENSNSVEPAVSSSESNVNIDVPPPTDEDVVKAQLRDLETEWTVANINADKVTLDRILADDFVGKTEQGQLYSKADYLRTIQRDSGVEKWDFNDLELNLVGDRASLSGKVTFERFNENDQKYEFLDKFVWRDGRWQATSSELKQRD
jgi:hypothetical protein